MMELNREQTIQALKCCSQKPRPNCIDCPLGEKRGCAVELIAKALDVINQQETEYNELYELVESYRKSSAWIPVNEKLPQRNGRHLVVCKGIRKPVIRFYDNGWSSLQEVTHWMPLPKPPKDKQK